MGGTWYKRGLFGPIQNIKSVSLLILNDAIKFQTFVISCFCRCQFREMNHSFNSILCQKLLLPPTEFASVASGESYISCLINIMLSWYIHRVAKEMNRLPYERNALKNSWNQF